ncbi:MAG: hypothetical protein HC859_17240 [Bacteroidia bacterium]|nr:hypothetical protein [Bacteroidia bacterium]
MIYYRQLVISRIKSAKNESEITDVIETSIGRLNSKNVNGHIIHRFLAGLCTGLGQSDDLSEKERQNMDFALGIVNKFRHPK